MPLKRFSFTKKERLLSSGDFSRAFKLGKKAHTKDFSVCVFKNGLAQNGSKRLGISVGSAVGNAVKRNRFKRIIREYFRLNKRLIMPGADADIVINVKKGAGSMRLKQAAAELDKALSRLNCDNNAVR